MIAEVKSLGRGPARGSALTIIAGGTYNIVVLRTTQHPNSYKRNKISIDSNKFTLIHVWSEVS